MKKLLCLLRDFILGQGALALMAFFFAIPLIIYVTVLGKLVPDWAGGISLILLIIGFTVVSEKIMNFEWGTKTKHDSLSETSNNFEVERHKNLLGKKLYLDPDVAKSLSQENIAYLKKYGVWLKALETGEINPISEKQKRFLDVCHGTRQPSNSIEIAWYNYKKVNSRLAGGNFGYHKNNYKNEMINTQESCNACGRKIDYCICSK